MASVTQTAIASSTTDTATPTFAAQAIGAQAAGDVIYALVGVRTIAGASLMSVAFDGVAATQCAFLSFNESGSIRTNVGIFSLERSLLPDPAQTDIDVAITHSQVCIRHALALAVSPDASAAAFAFDTSPPGDTNVSVNTPQGGIVIGCAYNGSNTDFTWTGLTEQSDIDVAGEVSNRFTTAYASDVNAETPRSITVTSGTDLVTRVTASFSAATVIGVDAAQAAVAGQNIDVLELIITVSPADAALAGQTIDIINNTIEVTAVDIAIAGQTINVLGDSNTLDLAAALYLALSDDVFITSRLGQFMSPSIHTRRPVPEGAEFPMIVVSPDIAVSDQDGLRARRPVIVRDITTYGQQDTQYRVVEEVAYYIREKFHRQRGSIELPGFHVIDIVATGPVPAPTDDFNEVARAVTLTIRLGTA